MTKRMLRQSYFIFIGCEFEDVCGRCDLDSSRDRDVNFERSVEEEVERLNGVISTYFCRIAYTCDVALAGKNERDITSVACSAGSGREK